LIDSESSGKKKHIAAIDRRASRSLSMFISYISREISLSASQRCLQLPRDCDDKRAPFTYRSNSRARQAGKFSGRSTRSCPQSFSHRNRSPATKFARAIRGGNPDSDRLRLKGSLASSFAMYRGSRTAAAITSPLSDLATLDSVAQFSLRLPLSISLCVSLFSFSRQAAR